MSSSGRPGVSGVSEVTEETEEGLRGGADTEAHGVTSGAGSGRAQRGLGTFERNIRTGSTADASFVCSVPIVPQ